MTHSPTVLLKATDDADYVFVPVVHSNETQLWLTPSTILVTGAVKDEALDGFVDHSWPNSFTQYMERVGKNG